MSEEKDKNKQKRKISVEETDYRKPFFKSRCRVYDSR